MKAKISLIVFLITFIMIFSGSGYLFAQESEAIDNILIDDSYLIFQPSDAEIESLLPQVRNPNAIVGPLIQTKWSGGSPFNDMVPFQSDNITRSPAGCGAIAMAQIMKYHNYPVRGTGQSESYTAQLGGITTVPSVNFNVNYDWANMLNSYTRANPGTERQRNAVAMLLYHAGVASRMNYGNNQTGSSTGVVNIARGLVANFGYDNSIEYKSREWYDKETWEEIIRSQLDAGLPVLYMNSIHIYIVDGYDNTGRFHINWGSGGSRDGWFFLDRLESLHPRYNEGHRIVTNIKPYERGISAGYDLGLRDFSVNKNSVSQNELFTVSMRVSNLSLFDTFPGGQWGAALVDNNNIIAIIGSRSASRVSPMSVAGSTEINCFIPDTVRPGRYQLRIVTREEGGNWRIVTKSTVSNGIPNVMNLSVTAGEANSDGYGMALTAFNTSRTTVSQNELFTVTTTLRNIAVEAFPGGQLGAALVDSSGRITEVIGTINRNALNSGAVSNAMVMNCFVPDTVRAGQYSLRIVVRPANGQWRVATMTNDGIPNAINLTVTAGIPNGGGYGMALTAFTADKSSVPQNELFTVSGTFRNVGTEAFPGGQLGAALVDNNGRIAEIIGVINRNALNSGAVSNAMVMNCFVPDTVRAGQYRLMAVVRPTNGEWRVATLALPDISAAINLTVTIGAANSGGYGMALTAFTVSSTAVSAGERFTVSGTFRNAGIEAFPGGQVGAALVDNSGRIVEVIGTANRNTLNPGANSNAMTINCIVPNSVRAGRYQLRIVVRPTGVGTSTGEWRIAGLSVNNAPTSIDFTVR